MSSKEIIEKIWRYIYPKDINKYSSNDIRVETALTFFEHIKESERNINIVIKAYDLIPINKKGNFIKYIHFNVNTLCTLFPYNDFIMTIRTKPYEVIGSINLALSLFITNKYHLYDNPVILLTRLNKLLPEIRFSDLKADVIGQLVSLRGYVVKVSHSYPHIGTIYLSIYLPN
jgi:DNA replicative helicase MCM subunit Mcm2 (Cdc46/Mcm family)